MRTFLIVAGLVAAIGIPTAKKIVEKVQTSVESYLAEEQTPAQKIAVIEGRLKRQARQIAQSELRVAELDATITKIVEKKGPSAEKMEKLRTAFVKNLEALKVRHQNQIEAVSAMKAQLQALDLRKSMDNLSGSEDIELQQQLNQSIEDLSKNLWVEDRALDFSPTMTNPI
jgi:uncharacterized membrane protein YccC